MRIVHGSLGDDRDARRDPLSDAIDTIDDSGTRADAMDVGAALRAARERRAISLDDLARATKIRVAILRAIETNQKDQLPQAVFLRGFVRAYAQEVGLAAGETVNRYLGQFERGGNIVESAPTRGAAETPIEQADLAPEAMDRDTARAVRGQWLVILIVIAASLVGFRLGPWRASLSNSPSPVLNPAPAVKTTGSSSTGHTPNRPEAGTAGSREPPAAGLAGDHVLRLNLQAGDRCWLAATVDGMRVVYRLMQPGEQHAIDVRGEAVLRVGNPAAFNFSINGAAGRSLGRAGKAVTVHITTENYPEFLRQ
jgi:cytoskeletal protein RodZ